MEQPGSGGGGDSEYSEYFENERWFPLAGWSKTLLPKDPPSYSDGGARQVDPEDERKRATRNGQIVTVIVNESTNGEGWQYATSFGTGGPGAAASAPSAVVTPEAGGGGEAEEEGVEAAGPASPSGPGAFKSRPFSGAVVRRRCWCSIHNTGSDMVFPYGNSVRTFVLQNQVSD